jgi:hypothetical protein
MLTAMKFGVPSPRLSLVAGMLLFSLSGCANFNSIHHKGKLDSGASYVSVDAKQRLSSSISVPLLTESGKVQKDVDGNVIVAVRTCNEPSPDTFSVYTAAIEANASKGDDLTAALKLATGESGSTIGIRTQSIQLLRDAMYRICEAHMSGGLDNTDYHRLLSKYQKSMVTLIAIEQLTNAVKPAPAVLTAGSGLQTNSQARNEAAKNEKATKATFEALTTKQSDTNKLLSEASNKLPDKPEVNCKDGQPSEEKYTADCKAYAEAKETSEAVAASLAKAKKEHEDAVSLSKTLESDVLLSTNLGYSTPTFVQPQLSDTSIDKIAGHVTKLVNAVYEDETVLSCLNLMGAYAVKDDQIRIGDGAASYYHSFEEGQQERHSSGETRSAIFDMCKGVFDRYSKIAP